MDDPAALDEPAIRATVNAALGADDGLPPDRPRIGAVSVEGRWAAVVLEAPGIPRAALERRRAALVAAFPSATFEVHADGHVFAGGRGFGPGRHVVVVLGGKGGVGKSTVAANLALTLSALGRAAGLVDADLNAPNVPHLLGDRLAPPAETPGAAWTLWTAAVVPPSKRPQPPTHLGIEAMSLGFLIPEHRPPALRVRGEVAALLRSLVFGMNWRADVLLVDAPPGTGDEIRAIAERLPLSGALLVTTPQDLAQMDAGRTLTLLEEREIPVIGMVQNMAFLVCPCCGEEIALFPESSRLRDAGVPLLGKLPFDARLAAAADHGTPLVLADAAGPVARRFARIGAEVVRWLDGASGGTGGGAL